MATSEVAHRQVVDLEKGPEDADAQLPVRAMAAAREKERLIPDLRRPPPEKHMLDLEKGIDQEGMDTPARQVSAVAKGEEQEHLILHDLGHHQVEGGELAAKMNPGQKKWLAYWLLVAAASVIILNNHIHAAPKDQLQFFPPEVAMFIVVLCAICLMLRAMKQMM